jgi:hypothetical protein
VPHFLVLALFFFDILYNDGKISCYNLNQCIPRCGGCGSASFEFIAQYFVGGQVIAPTWRGLDFFHADDRVSI